MNPRLALLQPYPFERLRELTRGVTPNPALAPISLGIGEPKHPTPAFIKEALVSALDGLASYPSTIGEPALREACAGWVERRYGVRLDAATQVLPVAGTREALFALAQTVVDGSKPGAAVVCPNPFYQIYEGAALLAGAEPVFANGDPAAEARGDFSVDWAGIDDATWARTQLLYVCSPGNPTGAVMPLAEWQRLFELSDRHGFVIASDECYSEIWFDQPPLGSLQAAKALGRDDFRRLIALTSLSKRSNVPGLRSGFVAGDAKLLRDFLLYRTYHGAAMGLAVQRASIAAWNDEGHVEANRALYRQKFERVTPMLAGVMDVGRPEAGFYLWPRLPEGFDDDAAFTRQLLASYNVAVLPGSYLSRPARGVHPGRGRVRLALVAGLDECVEAADRIVSFIRSP
ncbi:MAG TPA: succinyldiaminopimelate transaminase [Methylibium sp.]|uniref:succinyldiaminopimelate transaminase n=1 Tax=Methylibium sp. TaxID=2067992 RepID=UPI002DB8FF53|nr:succinyldiaminopimelate transaminase [Methylibium sp.]HEU4460637.1 succinyldiaminopimelate transaminase [Methylibium sp.]